MLLLLGPVLGSLSRRAPVSGRCAGKPLLWTVLWDSGERQGCRLQPGAASALLRLSSSLFLPPLWSLFPNPLGLHKCMTWFLKKASFFSLIIKLPRNNGCHLKQQHESSFPTTHRHCHLCSTSEQLGAPRRSLSRFFPALHRKLARGHCCVPTP